MDVDTLATNISWALTPTNLFGGATSGTGKTASIFGAYGTNGVGTITYTFQMPSGETFTASKNFWVGFDVDFDGTPGVAVNLPGEWNADISCGVEPINYQWYITQPGENERMCGTNNPTFQLSIETPSLVPETYYLRLAASDAARHLGSSDTRAILVYGTLAPFFIEYSLLVSPNPTSSETTLSIESTSETSSEINAEWEFDVYDQGQQLKAKKTKIKGKSATLNTSGWNEGVYIVRATYKGNVLTNKLVVKNE